MRNLLSKVVFGAISIVAARALTSGSINIVHPYGIQAELGVSEIDAYFEMLYITWATQPSVLFATVYGNVGSESQECFSPYGDKNADKNALLEKGSYDWLTGLALGLTSHIDSSPPLIDAHNFRLTVLLLDIKKLDTVPRSQRTDSLTNMCTPKSLTAVKELIRRTKSAIMIIQIGAKDESCHLGEDVCEEYADELQAYTKRSIFPILDYRNVSDDYIQDYINEWYNPTDVIKRTSKEHHSPDINPSLTDVNLNINRDGSTKSVQPWYEKPIYITAICVGGGLIIIVPIITVIIYTLRKYRIPLEPQRYY